MSTIDNLPPLREVINTHDLKARKSLGQNFLLDLNLTAKIARQAGDMTECDVLEIGPGPGGLTRGLLSEGARRVLAIEKDKRCLPALAEIAEAYPDRLTVIEGDALELHWDFITEGEARYTVIRDGASIIWKELAFYEGFKRFGEVAMILKAKYGNRLRDLEPTQESYLYLLGDSLAADGKILQIRGTLGA